MLKFLSEAWLFDILFVNKVRSFKDSSAALCLLGISSVGLESSCSLHEWGQFEDLTAQAFPSTGITVTTRVSAETVHPLWLTLLSHLTQTVAFAGVSWRPKLRSLSSSITGEWLISFFVSRFYIRHLEQVCTKTIITGNASLLVLYSTLGNFCILGCLHYIPCINSSSTEKTG